MRTTARWALPVLTAAGVLAVSCAGAATAGAARPGSAAARADAITTVAGTGKAGYSGNGGLATRAELAPFVGVPLGGDGEQALDPAGLAVSRGGNIVVADSANNRVRVIAARSGIFYGMKMTARHIYTVAGTGIAGFSGDFGPGTRAEMSDPGGVAVDQSGNILVSDQANAFIRVIANRSGTFYGRNMTAGDIYMLAGSGSNVIGNGIPATKAELEPMGLAVDPNGNVLLADKLAYSTPLRVVAEKTGTFYGQPMVAGDIYTVNSAPAGELNSLGAVAIAVDHAGNVVIASAAESRIEVLAVRSGTFYGVKMTAGDIYKVAGTIGGHSGDGGPATKARLYWPSGIAVDAAGNLLIADSINNRVRMVAERAGTFYGVKVKAGDIYTLAGTGGAGYSGDNGPATKARLHTPCGIVVYGNGLLVLDDQNNRVREVSG